MVYNYTHHWSLNFSVLFGSVMEVSIELKILSNSDGLLCKHKYIEIEIF